MLPLTKQVQSLTNSNPSYPQYIFNSKGTFVYDHTGSVDTYIPHSSVRYFVCYIGLLRLNHTGSVVMRSKAALNYSRKFKNLFCKNPSLYNVLQNLEKSIYAGILPIQVYL